ncbi:hypothetical protein CVT24_007593 [Panaeolus cyanescens]|uniref:Sacsin/Nov domain-containing protein n=1 Tax=Panaeolus cyanescens TaxID=181874 RepID=A0A409YLZ4_9AGAR|nr:hypothetical protein CVT24_007593 [Panaeolus cyanescens]
MAEDFSQRTSPIAVLRGILAGYPFSAGILKEIIQNSEDARATKQIFFLDRRTHPSTQLYHADLVSTQGPALLAFNDALFKDDDWTALRNMYQSSKGSDSTKIGKFGIGFRSVFHLTDCPQILSGKGFAIFDPLQAFTGSEGKKLPTENVVKDYPDHLQSILPTSLHELLQDGEFNGTIVRCPLRLSASPTHDIYGGISNEIVRPDRIGKILADFVEEGLDDTALFLKNIQQITIIDIDQQGVFTTLANATFARHDPEWSFEQASVCKIDMEISRQQGQKSTATWIMTTCQFPDNEATDLLSQSIPSNENVASTIRKHKLNSTITLAVRNEHPAEVTGRLFTHLPLPITTSFNAHINAMFALTSDRQHLLNGEDRVAVGSSDHILRKWNTLLFDHFIPQTWRRYLRYVAEKATSSESIYSAWPGRAAGGEWRNVPMKLFEAVLAEHMAIWPVFIPSTSSNMTLKALDAADHVVARPSDSSATIEALTSLGLNVIQLPQTIWTLLETSSSEGLNMMSPGSTHAALLVKPSKFSSASSATLNIVLQYLLSDSNVRNIVGLPLIPHTSGYVSLQPLSSKSTYTLLENGPSGIFNELDASHNIALNLLPDDAASLLLKQGPGLLNVAILSNDRIVQYLDIFLQRNGTSTPSRSTVFWLLSFWEWLADWNDRELLQRRIQNMDLIPCMDGLKSTSQPLFNMGTLDSTTISHLQQFALAFVHPDFKSWKLSSIYTPKDPTDLHAVIDAIPTQHSLKLTRSVVEGFLRHCGDYATSSTMRGRPFTKAEIQKLRRLPLFVVVDPDNLEHTLNSETFGPIPPTAKIQFMQDVPGYLPILPNTVFLKLSLNLASKLTDLLSPASDRISSSALLELALDNFRLQTASIWSAILEHVESNQFSIPPSVMKKLANTPFLKVGGGNPDISPAEAIDPSSPLARLFEQGHAKIPLEQGAQDDTSARLQCLRNIGLMQTSLTTSMFAERILYLSRQDSCSTDAVRLSQDLLLYLYEGYTDFDLRSLDPTFLNHQNLRWLPTDKGLACPKDSWDASDRSTSKYLYNLVIPCLKVEFDTYGLQGFMGWDKPLPQAVILKQFDLVLDNSSMSQRDRYTAVSHIISALSHRQLSTSEWDELRRVARIGRCWVPTPEKILVEAQDAIFDTPIPDSGLYRIYVNEAGREFMAALGCMERPGVATIIRKLRLLGEKPPSNRWVQAGLRLLTWLPGDLSPSEQNEVVVPDITRSFRPLRRTKYNDVYITPRGPLSDDLGEYFLAHPQLDDSLAYRLQLDRLGLQFATALPGLSMGAKPLAQIQNVLKAYSPEQFLVEFIANAVDANATRFTAVTSEYTGSTSSPPRILSPSTMSGIVNSPSIIIHNDSVFEDRDFSGICETSVGTKGGVADTIGRFGLGSATMFYFCEVAMIISRNNVLFLNPSGMHLPNKQTAFLLGLNQVRKYYPDHLAPVHGLFDFDATDNMEGYQGTIFVLFLRSQNALDKPSDLAYEKIWEPKVIRRRFFDPFFDDLAPNSLLFTQLESIETISRSQSGHQHRVWRCHARRSERVLDSYQSASLTTTYSFSDVEIISSRDLREFAIKWRVAYQKGIPVPHRLHSPGFRFQDPAVAGIAARIGTSGGSDSNTVFRYFSTLPLPIQTRMRVHIMASFYLSPDRRSVRLDKSDAPDTKYNHWLLRDIIPPLYLFLLESLVNEKAGNKHWWPKVVNKDFGDHMCEDIIEAFYAEHLPSSPRQVFNSISSHSPALCPSEVVVLQAGTPPAVRGILEHFKSSRLPSLGTRVTSLIEKHTKASINYVTPEFLRDEILSQESAFCLFFSPAPRKRPAATYLPTVHLAHQLQEVYDYLASSNLPGLPILLLSNNTFVEFERASSTRKYFGWPTTGSTIHSTFRHHFTPNHFIHPELDQKAMAAFSLNVVTFGATQLLSLISDTLSKQETLENASRATANWIADFWRFWVDYKSLGIKVQDIREFPLVPTTSPNQYVSLKACEQSGCALLIQKASWKKPLEEALQSLGLFTVCPWSENLPPGVSENLHQTSQYPWASLEKLVNVLGNVDVVQKIGDGTPLHNAFATWARDLVSFATFPKGSGWLQSRSRGLPIWPTIVNSQQLIRSANSTYMLPQQVNMHLAARFISKPLSEYEFALERLNGDKIEIQRIPSLLSLSGCSATSEKELRDYKKFLLSWIDKVPHPCRSLYVPNFLGEFQPAHSLYARDHLFCNAFGEESEHFVSPVFSSLESQLDRHGIKRQSSLDFASFVACANAIDIAVKSSNDNAASLCERASVVFKAYATDAAISAHKQGAQKERLLSRLDELDFIPRRMGSYRLPSSVSGTQGIKIPENITSLAHVVKPSILVREEFEAVAWTQRACFKVQPDQCILPIYDKIGKPSTLEVVLHLESLCKISKESDLTAIQKAIIVEDVKASYSFLTKHLVSDGTNTCDPLPTDLSTKEIFLNVHDPADTQETWTWRKAKELIYTDRGETQHVYGVKRFLESYRALLTHAGVLTEFQPQLERPAPAESEKTIREKFDELRTSGLFMDVTIEAINDQTSLEFLPAHLALLAASSSNPSLPYLDATNQTSNTTPIVLSPRHDGPDSSRFSETAVTCVLNYIYSTTYRVTPQEILLPHLLQAFLLAYRWQIDDVFALIETRLVKSIKPRTLADIQKMAKKCDASSLISACEKYNEENRVYIERVLGEY